MNFTTIGDDDFVQTNYLPSANKTVQNSADAETQDDFVSSDCQNFPCNATNAITYNDMGK